MVSIFDDERIDYLPNKKLKIIQSSSVFSFSIDAVLLAKFCYVPIQKGEILDLCSGNGVIPLLLSERSKANITGVEIQHRLYDMAMRSAILNQLEKQITFIQDNILHLLRTFKHGTFDTITCNPPYFQTVTEKERNENEHLAIARHEIYCTLKDVIEISSKLVRQKGKVALVHRPERLSDIVYLMKRHGIEPKRVQFVHPKQEAEANMVLVEGIKDGKPGLKVLPPIIVYQNEQYSTEFRAIYGV